MVALVYNHPKDVVVLTEQFRYPTYEKGPGWILELAAGIVEPDEAPADTMRRELAEEIGYVVHTIRPISTFYVSPGGSSERIHLFFASVTDSERTSMGGGVLDEGEDIRRVELPFQRALEMIDSKDIMDAKTVIGLQWLQLNKAGLFGA